MNIRFKKGTYTLNKESNFNFQLNRLIMWDGGDLNEVQAIASSIQTSEDWKRELIALGDRAFSEGRTVPAIGYYRMSEFFMYDGDPDKKIYYQKATELFYRYYQDFFERGEVEWHQVPYEDVFLPVMHCRAKGPKKDVILLHGGNDSYFEEFFFPMLYLAEHGFEVYLFEGPGQGGVMRIQNKHFTHAWEKPVKAILDQFHLSDVTIIGASLGGMLAPRAAAFEPRISRVIAWSIFPNFQEILLAPEEPTEVASMRLVRWMIKHNWKGVINFLFHRLAKSDEVIRWALNHGMYAYQAKSPFDYLQKMGQYQMIDIADRITQDVLIVGANHDHFIPYTMVGEEINALTEVHSLTFRLFTENEDAGNHCNCGNTKLALDTFMNWILQIKGSPFLCI